MASIVRILVISCVVSGRLTSANKAKPDLTFRHFCAHPPNFGKGEFDEGELICSVTYEIKVSTDQAAHNFCDMQHPFSSVSVSRGSSNVVCKIKSHYKCEDAEVLIGKKCFLPRRSSPFTMDDCGRRHKLHTIDTPFEQKWIAALMRSHSMIWVANKEPHLKDIKIVEFQGKTLHGVNGRLISRAKRDAMAIITARGTTVAIPPGRITYVTKDTLLALLCSRDADVMSSYTNAYISQLGELGLKSYAFLDADKKLRPFSLLRNSVMFETKNEFEVSPRPLHEACNVFPNGYAASPFDFDNADNIKFILRQEKVNMVAAPARRAGEKVGNLADCSKDALFKSKRASFFVEYPDGNTRVLTDSKLWRDKFPDRTCADVPRTAVGYSQEGLVDIPSNARLFTLCTFGQPFKPKTTPADLCHTAAHFDETKRQCVCNKENSDIRETTMFEKMDGDDKIDPGTLCVDCDDNLRQDPVILFDNSGRIINGKLEPILTAFLFISMKGNYRVNLIAYGKDSKFCRQEHYFVRLDTDQIKSWIEMLKYMLACKSLVGGILADPIKALSYIYREFYHDLPSNKRTLIFITTGGHPDEKEVIKKLDKFKENDVKVIPVGVDMIKMKDLEKYASRNIKSFLLKTSNDRIFERELSKVATYVDQLLARNVCLHI